MKKQNYYVDVPAHSCAGRVFSESWDRVTVKVLISKNPDMLGLRLFAKSHCKKITRKEFNVIYVIYS